MKPLECFRRPIAYHTKPGGLIYEPFAGSRHGADRRRAAGPRLLRPRALAGLLRCRRRALGALHGTEGGASWLGRPRSRCAPRRCRLRPAAAGGRATRHRPVCRQAGLAGLAASARYLCRAREELLAAAAERDRAVELGKAIEQLDLLFMKALAAEDLAAARAMLRERVTTARPDAGRAHRARRASGSRGSAWPSARSASWPSSSGRRLETSGEEGRHEHLTFAP